MSSVFRVLVTPRLLQTDFKIAAEESDALLNYQVARLFFLGGEITQAEVETLCQTLLADPVTETYHINSVLSDYPSWIEVTLLAGVTDSEAENLTQAAHQLGVTDLTQAASGQAYFFADSLSPETLRDLAENRFSNGVIQRYSLNAAITAPFINEQPIQTGVERILIQGVSDEQLLVINRERQLALDLAELQTIREYFETEQRDPSDAELEMLAQTWSEHCVHKTFKADITYSENDEAPVQIQGLLKTYIRRATDEINKPWVHSAFVDNAGIIAFDDNYDLAFKVETHNHPSALEPFGGANTGVGGVIRDVLGVSARPIANTDILCFGWQDTPKDQLPAGVLHPTRIQAGVVHGIEDYGNKMGIPTVNGAIFYHAGYTANPLVFCGCLGLLPHNSHPSNVQAGDLIVVLGGHTGRDGIRGATFSSLEMDTTTSQTAGSAVQIGHPIHEKQILEVLLPARDAHLYHAITDCGAGGLSSAVGEMAGLLGAEVQLEKVPLKYAGLSPWEIWLSEAQERMVLAVPSENWAAFQALAERQDIDAVCIGTFQNTGRLKLTYDIETVADLSLEFLHDGIPTRKLTAAWQTPMQPPAPPKPIDDYNAILLKLLAHPNIRSKEQIIRRYDHEVQGATAVKPLVGLANHAPSDAAVLRPRESQKAVALSVGLCPQYGDIDPYAMAWAAIDEAMRNIVSVGGDPDQTAILDNFCWGNPLLPDRLGALVRCTQGCYDAAIAYQTPFISGKDSLNNEYLGADGKRHAIPSTLLISAVSVLDDVQTALTMDFKAAGNRIYLLGDTRAEMGGSHFNLVEKWHGGTVPQPNPNALALMQTLHQAIQNGWIAACHDCSEGGLGVAMAEMCLGGGIGASIQLKSEFTPEIALFSESLTRFVVEVSPEFAADFEPFIGDYPMILLGETTEAPYLVIDDVINLHLDQLNQAFSGELPKNPNQKTASPYPIPAVKTHQPNVLILHANGTNRDHDAALACQLAGGIPEIVHVNQVIAGEKRLADYQMLILAGGFSYGDDLGAGVLFAQNVRHHVGADLQTFITAGKPVLGICNGFQALIKSGLVWERDLTLTYNELRQFECRWVYLEPNQQSSCLFIQGMDDPIYCPVAHGEGRLQGLNLGLVEDLVALTYSDSDYPANPNGSALNIAGLTNAAGNVLGLMPHPENHIFPWQHPRWTRGETGWDGLRLFINGVKHA